jgi:hypothetical protein
VGRANGRGPPPLSAGSDPQIKQPARKLTTNEFTRTRLPPQDAAPALPRERLACLARKIHGLGERVLFELLVELASGRELGPVLERYGRLAPLAGFIRSLNGDRLPAARLVGGRRS